MSSLCAAALAVGLGVSVLGLPSGVSAQSARQGLAVEQWRVRRTVVRVPVRPAPMRALAPVAWKEKRGPKCLPNRGFAGAQVSQAGKLDLFLRDGRVMRAELAKTCRSFDLHQGFYLRATDDRQMCAGRDAIHTRSGGECGIKRFRQLTRVPAR